MGGEKAQKLLSFWPIMGSPPHGRGKVSVVALCIAFLGITPA